MGLPNQCQFLCLALILPLGALASQAAAGTLQEASIRAQHEEWASRHERVYADEDEKEARFQTFKENLAFIDSWNSDPNKTFKLAINHFADLTEEERKASRNTYTGRTSSPKTTTSFLHENVSLAQAPAHLDWRNKLAVTPVKSQGKCGCCWAFAAVAAIESITQISTGGLVSLSDQQINDCTGWNNGWKNGCAGGWSTRAFEYVIKNGGITTEYNYPYKAADGTCNTSKAANHAAKISAFENVPPEDEQALLKAVTKQPVTVSLNADGHPFEFYSSGVFNGEGCGIVLNHQFAITGYGTDEKGTKYWLAKNSYGPGWGEEGYIKMQRDVGGGGVCGIAMEPTYPIA